MKTQNLMCYYLLVLVFGTYFMRNLDFQFDKTLLNFLT